MTGGLHLVSRDDGCDVAPACLECPLPSCRYETPGGLRALRNQERDAEIVRLSGDGLRASEIAELVGISRRRVFGVLTEEKRRTSEAVA